MSEMRVDWVLLDQAAQAQVQVGDVVSVEAGGAPTLRVLKLADGRAWLRDEIGGMDCVASLSAFHWKASAPHW
ncbi:MAG TPA: hypothetical protein VHX64_11280 [Caulobacteraceae bacterium]|nr:hypothetical protein [Caulobacteraceae bacterium]